MTDKVQKIREEVERLFKHVKDSNFESDSGAFYYLKDLLDFIDSLQEEPISKDLEEAACEYADGENPTCPCEDCLIKTFKAGANYVLEQIESLPNKTIDIYNLIEQLRK